MPQWRKLHTKVTESLDFNEMPDDLTRLVWVLLPLGLDREGRSLDNASLVKARLMPLRDDVPTAQVAAALDWYASRGMIVRYQADGHSYFYVPTFRHYQGNTSREAESTYPEPPAEDSVTESPPTHDQLMTNSSTDVDVDVDVDVEEKREGANAPERRKRRAPAPVPPAVRVFQEITNRYPPKAWYARIDDAVGTDPDNLAFWRQVVTEYLGTYQNQGNVKAMLDFYRRRELPGTRRGNGRDSPRASPVVLERHVADLPKGWLQEPFDPDEEPQL